MPRTSVLVDQTRHVIKFFYTNTGAQADAQTILGNGHTDAVQAIELQQYYLANHPPQGQDSNIIHRMGLVDVDWAEVQDFLANNTPGTTTDGFGTHPSDQHP